MYVHTCGYNHAGSYFRYKTIQQYKNEQLHLRVGIFRIGSYYPNFMVYYSSINDLILGNGLDF